MKVYVVKHDEDCGEYTSHEVTDAIFSTQENAYHYAKQQGSGYYWEVVEYEIDQDMKGLPPIDPTLEVGPVYRVSIQELGGTCFNHNYDRITLRHPEECEIHDDVVSSPKSRSHAFDRARELLIERITNHIKAQDQLLADVRRLFPDCYIVLNADPERSLRSKWELTVKRTPKADLHIIWGRYGVYQVSLGALRMSYTDSKDVILAIQNLA